MAGGAIMKNHKSMIDWVEEYVNYRRSLGFQLQIDESELIRFAKYVDEIQHRGPLTTEILLSWVQKAKSTNFQHRRFETVCSFAGYVSIYIPETEIPSRATLKIKCRRPEPYIYSTPQIKELLKACDELSGNLRPQTYNTLFGLLAATGLRVSEALKLNRKDVDLDHGILTVRETKFRKSRLLPVHTSTIQALRRYTTNRNNIHPLPRSEMFFLSEAGSSLPYPTVNYTFQKLRRCLGWKCKNTKRYPRIRDLRHTFACQRLLKWYEEGVNVNHSIPFLSAYLGHIKVSDTYWYLTGVPKLMAITACRFEKYAKPKRGGKP